MILDNGSYWEPEDFQLDAVADLFAGTPETWLLIPEGNSKTTTMAGVGLYWLDYLPDASILLAAASRDQCGLLLGQAAGFIRRDAAGPRHGFHARFRILEGYRRITSLAHGGGRMQVYAADDKTGDGVIFDLALVDELHRHRDMKLYMTWAGKLDKRGGQIGVISTAGAPGSEFEKTVTRIRQEGRVTHARPCYERIVAGTVIVHRFAVPDDADVHDVELVKAANPLSAITVDALQRKHDRKSITELHWRRFTCNQAVRDEDAAISVIEWEAARTNDRPPPGVPVLVGLDLGWNWDTTAIVPLWAKAPDRRILLDPTIIVPPRDGTATSPSTVQQALLDVHAVNPIATVAMDKASGGEQMAEWITGTLGAKVVLYTNGNVERARVAARFYEGLRADPSPELLHTGDVTLTQHVMNARAVILRRGDVIFERPSQTRSAAGQDDRVIDGLVAASIVNDAAVAAAQTPPLNLDDYRIVQL